MKTFYVSILLYGKWVKYRDNVELSSSMPRDHIHMVLSELYIYSNHFEHIKDVYVCVGGYEKVEDIEGNKLAIDFNNIAVYSWMDSDYEDFRDFHKSILSEKEFIF